MSIPPATGTVQWAQGDDTVVVDISPTEVVTAFSRLCSRIARGVASLAPDDWERPTRCGEWKVVDIVNHLADSNTNAVRLTAAAMQGQPTNFFASFDARTSPKARTDAADRTPAVAQQRLVSSAESMLAAYDALDMASVEPLVETPLGLQPLALATLHRMWDAWLHERDLFIPLGAAVPELADEVRLVALYSLRMVGGIQGMFGREMRVPLTLSGAIDDTLVLDVHGMSMSARVLPAAERDNEPEPHLRGDATTTVDALCGRGEIADVIDGPDDLRRNVTILRKVLRGD